MGTPHNALGRALGKYTPEQQKDILPALEAVLMDVLVDHGLDEDLGTTDRDASARVLSGCIKAVRIQMEIYPKQVAPPADKVRYTAPPRPKP